MTTTTRPLPSVAVQLVDHLAQAVLEFTDNLQQAEHGGVVDGVDRRPTDREITQAALQCLRSVGLIDDSQSTEPEVRSGVGHHKLPALHGRVTRYVGRAFLAVRDQLHRRAGSRRSGDRSHPTAGDAWGGDR